MGNMKESSNRPKISLDLNGDLKFSREQGFFDKSIGIKCLIGAAFVFALFTILHFQEVRVEVLELGSTAPSYIVAQTNLEFYDEEATIILRQDAVRNIGKIYQISDRSVHERRVDFENFLIKDEKWRNEVKEASFEEMYKGVELLEKGLLTVRFTDPRTLKKMENLELATPLFLTFTPADPEKPVLFPLTLWGAIKKISFPEKELSLETERFILNYFQNKEWDLSEDVSQERLLRRRIQMLIPEKYTRVSAGSRIIDQGERVTSRHLAILQAMKEALNEQRNLWHPFTALGNFFLALLLTSICAAYFRSYFPEVLASNRKLFLIVTVIILSFAIAKLTEFIFLNAKTTTVELIRYPLVIPFSAILLSSLLGPLIATFCAAFLTMILVVTLSFDWQGFMLVNIAAALVAILSIRGLRQRREIFIVCGKAWMAAFVVLLSMHFSHGWAGLVTDAGSAASFMLLTAVLVVGMLPLLEASFKIMTDVTLMEYMDPNHDLLRRLSIEAPGTYQHSVIVGNLAEAAALSIGANGLFCRAATLYHDVGKMATPQYFSENQHGEGMNIHQLLTPQESAQVIIAHVAEGVALARKANLPEQFIDIIKEHHGTTLVYYFYRKMLERVGGDRSLVNVNDFRYAGPTPRSKESAIIMIADSLESASRSLEACTKEALMDLTHRIVREKGEEGQFDHNLLTLEELAIIKETLVKTLVAYGHSRVKYPTREKGEETLRGEAA